ncbi:MAG: HAMP domain-containing sensor histidine kinase [Chloroflexota bacterium]
MRHHFPRHRPPWWPQDEPWPPHGPPRGPHWSKIRRFFFWRIAGLFAMLAMLATGLCSLAFWLAFISWDRLGVPQGALPFIFLAGFGVGLGGLLLLARLLRRIATPVGELMESVSRVEAGDYAVRAVEHGPAEVRALSRAFNAMVERLQLTETQRRNLLADVTHELRTPLTIIQGNLEGLLDGVYPRDDAHLAAILEDTRVLARLIDDLRTLALAESGALPLHREPTDVGVLASETVASFRPQAEAGGVELSVAVADEMPLLDLDPVRLREVLANLIANALRYTPAGGRVSVTGQVNPAEQRVIISVSDTGTGISPEILPHIFDRFYKTGDSHGTGLGLAIARNLVAAHGGEIQAQSDGGPPPGTTIRFSLPLT